MTTCFVTTKDQGIIRVRATSEDIARVYVQVYYHTSTIKVIAA